MASVLWQSAAVLVAVGLIDFAQRRRRYHRDLRMSRQDIRDESKEMEGNVQAKAQARRMMRDFVRRRMMSQVPKATAVIVNPTHYAVAIYYAADECEAPQVLAKGKNYLAARIRATAIKHGVPIVENPPLARSLYRSAEVGQEIPAALYRAVAEVLAYVYRMTNGRFSRGK
jgi:flagellar biosynthetic protein FlhB